MSKKENKSLGKENVELTEKSLDGVSGGKNYKIHEFLYKDLNGKPVRMVRETKIYSNSGKLLDEEREVFKY